MKGLSGVERNKVAYVKEQTEKFIEQLQKSKKAGVLGKVFKALGIVGTILAGMAAVLCPSPMTIAMFAVALVMTLEPMLADAAGYKSVIETGMGKMMEGLTNAFGPVGGAIVGALLIAAIMMLATTAVSGGLSLAASALSRSTSAALGALKTIPNVLKNLLLMQDLTQTQQATILRVLETIEASIVAAQTGVQFAHAKLNLEIANLMHAFQVDQAIIDLIENLSKSISQDASAYQEHINRLLQFLPQFFAPLNA
jgi:hypothetical protein